MHLLRVDMNTLEIKWEPVPDAYERLGGRALIANVLLNEVPPRCDPLGPDNKLIIAPGLLGGSGITTTGRLSIGGKSPLTKGVKEANAGGTAGDALGKLELKAIIIENAPIEGEWYFLYVKEGGTAELLPADDIVGLGTYETSETLQKIYGDKCAVISIGQAGEYQLKGSGIAVTGYKNQRSNHAARGGLGAVMGSKQLKAVVLEIPRARRSSVNPELLKQASHTFFNELYNSPKLGKKGAQHLYGTSVIVTPVNGMGSLPTRNFSSGNFEGYETLRGEHLRETILERGGEISTACMPGCVISCRNVYVDEEGKPIVGTLQYETIALIGSNLGLSNLDDVARLNFMCNDYGLDTIETGAALGVAIEAGLAEFGDLKSITKLLEQVPQKTEIGLMIGNGAAATGIALDIERVPVALGQAMPGYDPRSLKGNGVTYATSPQGADHTAGNAFGARLEVNPLGIEGQKELSLKLQIIAAMLDSTGLCLFARPPVLSNPQLLVDMINGIYGWGWTPDDLDEANRDVLRMELEFNRKAGITAKDYRLPAYMTKEPLPPHQAVFDIPETTLDEVFESL
jgi:aldehyde:ferredoxin oxidoreductase